MKISFLAKFFILVMFISISWNTSAQTIELSAFTGHAVAAEITTAPVEIINGDQSPFLPACKSPAYAVVVVKMHRNRSISMLDYSLTINNITAPCITAVYNMDSFVVNTPHSPNDARTITLYPSETDYVRLLFVFDSSKINLNSSVVPAQFKSNLSGRKTLSIKLSNLGGSNFTDVKNIPANGMLK